MNKQAEETKHLLCWRTNTSKRICSWLEEINYSLQSLYHECFTQKQKEITAISGDKNFKNK